MNKIIWIILLPIFLNAQDTLPQLDTLSILPLIAVFTGDEEDETMEQEIAPMLQASRDGVLQAAGFTWGVVGFRYREQATNNVYLNDAPIKDYITEGNVWRWWNGLNDMIRFSETRGGIAANRHGPSTNNGYTSIESIPMLSRAGKRFGISSGNRSDLFICSATHHSGLLHQKWALSLSTYYRYSQNLLRDHTLSTAGGMWLAIQRVFKKNNFTVHAFAVPNYREGASTETEEVIQLAGYRYNSKVGQQQGVWRNIAVSQGLQPVIILSHQMKINKTTAWRTHVQWINGQTSYQALNYSDAANPSPVYYKYLPNYLSQTGDTAAARLTNEQWLLLPPQLDFDKMIHLNQLNLYSIDPNVVDTQATRARFILERKVDKLQQWQYNTLFNTRINGLFLSTGITAAYQSNRRYKELADLLGATFWLDYDTFVNAGNDSLKQNNLDAPDKPIGINQRFGYDFSLQTINTTFWLQLEHTGKHVDYYLGGQWIESRIWREGYMRNGKFPNNSFGKSRVMHYGTPCGKAGGIYKINGRHFITMAITAFLKSPTALFIFPSPNTRNTLVPVAPSFHRSAELAYEWRIPGWRGRITGFYTSTQMASQMQTYWHDGFNSMVNQLTIFKHQVGKGLEGFFEHAITGTHLFTLCWYIGDFRHKGPATLSAWQDNADTLLFNQFTAYLSNYHTANGPDKAISCSYKFTAKRYWNIGGHIGATNGNYSVINPLKRTTYATGKYLENEIRIVQKIIQQERLPPAILSGLVGGWSKRFHRKYTLAIMASINNLLNQRKVIRSVEALRFDPAWPDRFSNRLTISNGIQMNLNLTFSY